MMKAAYTGSLHIHFFHPYVGITQIKFTVEGYAFLSAWSYKLPFYSIVILTSVHYINVILGRFRSLRSREQSYYLVIDDHRIFILSGQPVSISEI